MRSKVPLLLLLLACTCMQAGAYAQPSIVYVDLTATDGANNGNDWDNAYLDLQDALPSPNTDDEVWVAEGTYRPAGPGGSRTAIFHMDSGTEIYGGFPSGGSTFADRNIELYETILSGDLNEDDGPIAFQNYGENSYHVVTGNLTDSTAILDGFTIIGGNADATGSPLPANATGGGFIVHGTAAGDAGSPAISNCIFKLNQARIGAGANNYRGSPTFDHCTFWRNKALLYGGGYYNTGGITGDPPAHGGAVLQDCRFVANTAPAWGGGSCSGNSSPSYINCDFVGNTVTGSGAGAFGGGLSIGCNQNCSGTPLVVNCTFGGNTALSGNGGGFNNEAGSNVKIHNCVFWENEDTDGVDESAQIYVQGGSISVDYTCIDGLVDSGAYDDGTNTGNTPDFVQISYARDDSTVFIVPGNTHIVGGSLTNDAGNNDEIPSGVDYDRDGFDRTEDDPDVSDTGNGTSPIVDMGTYEFVGSPYLLTGGVAGTPFSEHAFNRFVDARAESSDGVNLDLGIKELTLVFTEQVRDVSASGTEETLSMSSFLVRETGGATPPTIASVCFDDGQTRASAH